MNNGLEVYILPKEGFNKTFATFTTKYGSIDNHFVPLNKEISERFQMGLLIFLNINCLKKKMEMSFSNLVNKGRQQMRLLLLQELLIYFQVRRMLNEI